MITMQFFATKKITLKPPKSQALLQEHEDGHCELHKDLAVPAWLSKLIGD